MGWDATLQCTARARMAAAGRSSCRPVQGSLGLLGCARVGAWLRGLTKKLQGLQQLEGCRRPGARHIACS